MTGEQQARARTLNQRKKTHTFPFRMSSRVPHMLYVYLFVFLFLSAPHGVPVCVRARAIECKVHTLHMYMVPRPSGRTIALTFRTFFVTSNTDWHLFVWCLIRNRLCPCADAGVLCACARHYVSRPVRTLIHAHPCSVIYAQTKLKVVRENLLGRSKYSCFFRAHCSTSEAPHSYIGFSVDSGSLQKRRSWSRDRRNPCKRAV